MKIAQAVKKFLLYAILIVFTLFVAFPLVYTLLASFKSNQEIMTAGIDIFPKKFILDNYKEAWVLADFKQYTWNSIYMSVCIVIGVVFTSSTAGYVFARGNFPGKKLIFGIFTSTMFLALGSITLYPLLQVTKFLHINTSLWGVIIVNVFGLQITNIFLVRGYVNSIPKEVDEAAKIDGCSFIGIFMKIIAPLLKPIMATVALLTFQGAWNDYLLPMVFTLGNPKNAPLVVGIVSLKSTGAAASSWNLMMAGTMISIIPILFIYVILNKWFISGLTSGAVKG